MLRILNLLVDSVVIVGLVIGATGLLFCVQPSHEEQRTALDNILSNAVVGLPIFYYFGMEAAFGRTLGKFLTGTRVVDKLGHKPTLLAIAGRTLCRAIPLEAFSFLQKNSGLHDTLSGTRVVLAMRPEEQE
jgi:uncharacterized RDD family membrane protein YckC